MLVNSWPGSGITVSECTLKLHWRRLQWLWLSVKQLCMLLDIVTGSFSCIEGPFRDVWSAELLPAFTLLFLLVGGCFGLADSSVLLTAEEMETGFEFSSLPQCVSFKLGFLFHHAGFFFSKT